MRQPILRRGLYILRKWDRPISRVAAQRMHRTTTARRLANAQGKQRMLFAQMSTHQKHALQSGKSGDGHAQMAHAIGSSEVLVAQAVVYVLTAQAAHQLGRQVQFF